jgi:formylglycine-generating enzyme required for sulfatase activity
MAMLRVVTIVLALLAPACASHHDRTAAPTGTPASDAEALIVPDREAYVETLPGTTFGFEMVPVPSPLPLGDQAHDGSLWMSRTEIPWEVYDTFVYQLEKPEDEATAAGLDAIVRPSEPYMMADFGFGHDGWPVICVSFQGAAVFCEWLSELTGRSYRLPTEEEWELVCRQANEGWCDGGHGSALLEHAWVAENAERASHAVGAKPADRLGLHDLLGNVAEWVTTSDGTPAVKGGSWKDAASDVTCAARKTQEASWNARDPQIPKSRWWLADANFVGFRVVCEQALPTEPDPELHEALKALGYIGGDG